MPWSRPKMPPAPAHALLYCERLEERVVPAVRNWTGDAGTQLASTPGNWEGNQVPVAGDSIVFQAGRGTYCVIDPAFTGTIADLTFGPGYPGTVVVNRNLTASGTTTVPGGILSVNPGFTLSAQVFNLTGGQLSGAGALQVLGSMTYSNATILSTQVTIAGGATLTISANVTLDAARVTNQGATTWSGGDITGNNGAIFNNYGSLSIASHNQFTDNDGAFNNFGTLSKALAGGTTAFFVPFNNNSLVPPLPPAQVNVTAGEVDFGRGGNDSAPFTTGPNGVIGFTTGGTNTLSQGADFLGSGTVYIPTLAEIQIPNANTIIRCDSTFRLATVGMFYGYLIGPGTFLVTGTFEWRGGAINNLPLMVTGTMDMDGAADQVATVSTINLQGDTTWAGGDIQLLDTTIVNRGDFEIQNNQRMKADVMDQTSKFLNAAGTVIKTVTNIGQEETRIEVPFQQTGGTLDLNDRRMNFQGGITQTAAGSFTYLDNGLMTVVGTFTVSAGKVTGFGTIDGNLTLNGGTLDTSMEAGTGQVTVTGDYEQTGTSTLKLKVGNRGGTIGPVYDQLLVLGNATLAGTLTIVQLAGFPAKPKDSFLVLDIWGTGTLAGTFGTPPDPTTWGISYVGGVTVTRK